MANPMTAAQVLAALKKWGVPVREMSEWKTHNRNQKGAWGPLNGFVWHHTGSDGTAQSQFLYDGSTVLPGPLCHIGLDQNGTAWLIGWGRTNHAGGGDPVVLSHVVNEDYTGVLKPTKGNSNGVDGNAHFYGMEIWYSGSHGMTHAQYSAALKVSAAILDFHKWTSKSVIGHGEWSNDKWDPGYSSGKMMDMSAVRNDIAATLKAGPGAKETDTVAVKSTTYKQVWETDAATPPAGHETDKNKTWAPMSLLKYTCEQIDVLNKKIDALSKKVG